MMEGVSISFPNLGIIIRDLPNGISIFGFRIAFYGIIIGLGLLAAMSLAFRDARLSGQNEDDYVSLALYGIFFAIIGARAYYVIFEWDYYQNNLLEIFNVRQGGLAIYGGVIGGVIGALVLAYRKKLSFWKLADTGAIGLITGQMIGRWGNFFNREAYGGDTNSLFAMRINIHDPNVHVVVQEGVTVIDNSYIQVHPTFLYESVWNLCVLIGIQLFKRNKAFNGEVFLWYLSGYGFGRFFIEGMRTDQLQIGNTGIAVSQLLSAVLFVTGVTLVVVNRIRIHKGLSTVFVGNAQTYGADLQNMQEIQKNDIENTNADTKNNILRAMNFAKKAHEGQTWILPDGSSISYFEGHLMGVYELLKKEGCEDEEILITAILHDCMEDSEVSYEELKELFGKQVADHVVCLTRKKGSSYYEYIDEVLQAEDDIATLVKLADREFNSRNLFNQGDAAWRQKKIKQAWYMLEKFRAKNLKDNRYDRLKNQLLINIEQDIRAAQNQE